LRIEKGRHAVTAPRGNPVQRNGVIPFLHSPFSILHPIDEIERLEPGRITRTAIEYLT